MLWHVFHHSFCIQNKNAREYSKDWPTVVSLVPTRGSRRSSNVVHISTIKSKKRETLHQTGFSVDDTEICFLVVDQ